MHPSHPTPTSGPRSATTANVGRMAGAIGLVLWVSCPLTWLLTAEVGPLVLGKMVIGTFCIGVYLSTNGGFFARLAGSRSTGLWALSALSVALVVALAGAVNYLAYVHPWEKDFTQEGLYTVSSQTQQVLSGLRTDVRIYAFYASHEQLYPMVEDVLTRYQGIGTHLHHEMVDPQARPDLVERYHITDRGPRIVVCARDQDARAKDVSEQEIINAIVQVAEQKQKKIYMLRGHGELDIADGETAEGGKGFFEAIGAEGYDVVALDLRQQVGPSPASRANVDAAVAEDGAPAAGLVVPADAAVVLALGPTHSLLPPESAALESYLSEGGRLMVFLEPRLKSGLEPMLRQWRIRPRDDLIVDTSPLNRLLGLGAAAPMVQPVHGDHPIVQGLESAMVMSTVRSLAMENGGLGGVEVTPLAHTAETAWGETRVGKDGTAQKDDRDNLPPLFVAAAAQRPAEPPARAPQPAEPAQPRQARLVVYGDTDWVSNKYLGMQGNRDFALNGLNWLAEREDRITIRPRSRAASQLYLSGDQMNQVKFLCMDILPVLIVAAGLGITLVRRQR